MELIEEVKELLIETEKVLKGSARRLCMARTVHALGERGKPPGRTGVRMESWDHPERSARIGERDRLSRCIFFARPQAESKSICPTCGIGYHRHRGWAESSRPAVRARIVST